MIILGVDEQTGRPAKISPDPGEAFVIFDGRTAKVLQTGERLSPAEVLVWRRRKIVRVAASEQTTPIEGTVIASDGFRKFQVNVIASWRVTDFVTAAKQGTIDIDAALRYAVGEKLAELDRRFEMNQTGADKVSDFLRKELQFRVVEFVKIIDIGGRVELDSSTTSHLGAVQHTHESTIVEHEQLVGDKHIELERTMLDEQIAHLTRSNAVREAESQLHIEQLRQQFAHDMARKQAELDLELIKQKLELYSSLSGTMKGLITLQLAQDPRQVEVAIRGVREHQVMMAKLNLDAVQALISDDSLEGYQLEDSAKVVLKRFLELAVGSINTSLDPHGANDIPPVASIETGDPSDSADPAATPMPPADT